LFLLLRLDHLWHGLMSIEYSSRRVEENNVLDLAPVLDAQRVQPIRPMRGQDYSIRRPLSGNTLTPHNKNNVREETL
jgi:hypothetical protein